ncbi:MAG: hypothetical protein V2J26_06485 [Pacificimonas sp.]|jgi:hypothetical protein|nr:hypothetical protein [Pacificimonas sp.]
MIAIAIALTTAAAAPASDVPRLGMDLGAFIDAAAGQCWVVGDDDQPIPRDQLDALKGEVEIECIVDDETGDTLI